MWSGGHARSTWSGERTENGRLRRLRANSVHNERLWVGETSRPASRPGAHGPGGRWWLSSSCPRRRPAGHRCLHAGFSGKGRGDLGTSGAGRRAGAETRPPAPGRTHPSFRVLALAGGWGRCRVCAAPVSPSHDATSVGARERVCPRGGGRVWGRPPSSRGLRHALRCHRIET